jgi:adenylylsulfate kinase-like enzyme
MIYWFTGQPGHGKTVLSSMLKDYLEDEKGKQVIHIDGDDLREIFQNKDYSKEGRIKNITFAQGLAKFCHLKGFDVVVSVVAPYKDVRDSFKEDMGQNMFELYVHTTEVRERDQFHSPDYVAPTENFIDVDTTEDTPEASLVSILSELGL